ncbi:MAG TPA: isoprenoid biosynthesis glyoxalase ElbB [Candidatus Cloacimonetes bacterium]|nr:isoprenoid biosynthesis glyoxalase ElbB [Candidatus Cloacimonadota bacterium]HEX37822.1 isoprenoid biosynthesis glyoxalase ElbB [Candidatus Cloacimonadota bacterium]
MQNASNLNIGVVLSGSGWKDGTEIHEAVCTLLALDNAHAGIIMMAPDKEQMDMINHLTNEPVENETRNVLLESARIARGEVVPIKEVTASELDGLIIPGGIGAMKNLCNYAVKGMNMQVDPDLEKLLKDMHEQSKPLGFICIAPMIAAKVFGAEHPKITIGNDQGTAQKIEAFGAQHVDCDVQDIVVDENSKIVTTPAYMLGPSISYINKGITKLVNTILELADERNI